ncbi:MAG: DUF1353 domain-containing protein [Candidatus Accumulibacter cognatus]|uniref:DUF1353 domain-containing protein n=1 Tax=Candidatus Accumulibacter cognatus TaxID=2954383 RepID=A0A7D5SFU2_9PROT|nr:MAG: DUF1353 domain-containing protein [Candidatus Accumulibacter cognatus]
MTRKLKVVALVVGLAVALLLLALLFLQLKAAPPSPDVRAFGDNRDWVLTEDMVYVVGNTIEDRIRIVVPKGFVTDFASIPQSLWSLGLSPHGQYSRAAVVHDYLYWAQPCTRAQADRLMVIAMKESNVGSFDEWAVYRAVDLFGSGPWEQNGKERANGIPRVIPQALLRPKDPNMSWKDYRLLVAKQGVRDPEFEVNPAYCTVGNSTQVPSEQAASTLRK